MLIAGIIIGTAIITGIIFWFIGRNKEKEKNLLQREIDRIRSHYG